MKNILNRGFSQMGLSAFVTTVQGIIAALTGNAFFPVTNPTLAAISAQLDVLTSAMTLPDPGARKQAVNDARTVLEQMLDDLADDLEKTANSDPVKLATTGYDLRKETTQTGQDPDAPQNVRLKSTGVSGEVQVLLDAVARAKSFEIEVTQDPVNGPWANAGTFSSTRGIVLKGQPRAKDIWVRVRALGPNNTRSGWSDPATILVS